MRSILLVNGRTYSNQLKLNYQKKKLKKFLQCFVAFRKSTLNFEHCENKDDGCPKLEAVKNVIT